MREGHVHFNVKAACQESEYEKITPDIQWLIPGVKYVWNF